MLGNSQAVLSSSSALPAPLCLSSPLPSTSQLLSYCTSSNTRLLSHHSLSSPVSNSLHLLYTLGNNTCRLQSLTPCTLGSSLQLV
ncbi:hypothetical protein XELAEV_18036353mg [Xenopus laevis]|uniref:Uncharacterized protein n=1 Tax=Xenopus laevis TaxID=8355 RepID=A0A974HCX3_XENLA|nr:hypothetical protein XELAEV_18036353mg [Xenopus laevis]